MFELFIEFMLSLYCLHNLVIKPRFWIGLHFDLFWWGYEIYCFYKPVHKIWVSIIHTSIGQIVWENDLSKNFSAELFGRIFSMNEQKSHYVYGILAGMSFLCSKSGHDQRETKIYDAWLTDFVWWVCKYMVNKGRSLISDPGWPCYYLLQGMCGTKF